MRLFTVGPVEMFDDVKKIRGNGESVPYEYYDGRYLRDGGQQAIFDMYGILVHVRASLLNILASGVHPQESVKYTPRALCRVL